MKAIKELGPQISSFTPPHWAEAFIPTCKMEVWLLDTGFLHWEMPYTKQNKTLHPEKDPSSLFPHLSSLHWDGQTFAL